MWLILAERRSFGRLHLVAITAQHHRALWRYLGFLIVFGKPLGDAALAGRIVRLLKGNQSGHICLISISFRCLLALSGSKTSQYPVGLDFRR